MRLFIDVQGTLIDDVQRLPIPGAVEFIDALNERSIPYVIITNNTKRRDFLEYLQGLGFAIDRKRYIDPLMVLGAVLSPRKIASYGVPEFLGVLRHMGYTLDYQNPEAVVLSVKSDYTFEEFAQIDEFLLQGAQLIGMHKTSLYAKGGKRYPGVGALLEMFSFACGVEYSVVGKPSKLFFDQALKKLGSEGYEDVWIISDDVQGDLMGAAQLGMKSCFVLSGKFKSAEEILPRLGFRPDCIAPSIKEAAKELGV